MNKKALLATVGGIVGIGIIGYFAVQQGWIGNNGPSAADVAIDNNDIGGVVTGPNGPEAGVWVIATTNDLPTKYTKIVVTDDQGRFVVPDLPKANYEMWVRGYGLVDSPHVKVQPGEHMNLKAVVAPNEKAAAQYYPPTYWYALLAVPPASDFPGTGEGPGGNGISKNLKVQAQWVRIMKTEGCESCHTLGDKATRTLEPQLGHFENSEDAWTRRIQSGQASSDMVKAIARVDAQKALTLYGEWTDRIAKGELPKESPPRPTGLERDVVVTEWDWSEPTLYLHDEISTDRRDPTVNANGLIYGSPELSSDYLPILDPVHNTTSEVKVPYRDPKTPTTKDNPIYQPSPYWGEDRIWDSHTIVHNPMLDEEGRVWVTARIRPAKDPAYCYDGSIESSKMFPMHRSTRQAAVYDPKTKVWHDIDLCFSTHHLQFAKDDNRTLYFSGGTPVLGYLNTKMYDKTHDEKMSQGWTSFVLDTNGNGKRDADVTEPGKPVDPTKDARLSVAIYGVAPQVDGKAVWGSVQGFPGGIVRVLLGDDPPKTAITELYEVPYNTLGGHSPRGMDIDTNNVVWVPLQSGHLASFDRRKCKGPLNGPKATGNQCPEGWTLYQLPGPQLQNVNAPGSAQAPYYTWVDQYDTFGLGKNTPFITGNSDDSLIALKDNRLIELRVPYPMDFFAKGLDGRIDDPNTGWKGRGLWTTYGSRTPAHLETGKGSRPYVVHLQLRPNPLAH